MERSSYLITLSSHAVEGARMGGGEAMSVYTHGMPERVEGQRSEDGVQKRLESFLDRSEWRDGPAVVVIPTEAISFRRLEFSFSDLKKIRQAIPFELESELLEGVGAFAYDFEVVPREQGRAEVLVYLVAKDYLQGLLDACEARHLDIRRVTFAGQALATAKSDMSGHCFHLYAGSDEAFIVYLQDGHLRAVAGLGGAPHRVLEETPCEEEATPTDRLRILLELSNNGNSATSEIPPVGVAQESVESGEGMSEAVAEDEHEFIPGKGEAAPGKLQTASLEKLQGELERIRNEANRFVRLYRPAEEYELQLDGLFAHYFAFKPESGEISLNWGDAPAAPPPRAHFGILAELGTGERLLGRGGGINFFRRLGTWVAAFMAYRWQLVTSMVLLVLLGGIWLGNHIYSSSILEQRLERVDSRLVQVLGISRPINSLTVNAAMNKLRDRRAKVLEAREATAYLENYNYDALVLLREVSRIMAQLPRMKVETLTYNRERFTLTGITPDYNDSESLKNRIAALDQFKNQEVSVTHQRTAQGILFRLFTQQ